MKKDLARAMSSIWHDLVSISFRKKLALAFLFLLFFILLGAFNTIYIIENLTSRFSFIYFFKVVAAGLLLNLVLVSPFFLAILLYLAFALEPKTSPIPTLFYYPANRKRDPWEVNALVSMDRSLIVRRTGIAATILKGCLEHWWDIKDGRAVVNKSAAVPKLNVHREIIRAFNRRLPKIELAYKNYFVNQQPLVLFDFFYLVLFLLLVFSIILLYSRTYAIYAFFSSLVLMLVFGLVKGKEIGFTPSTILYSCLLVGFFVIASVFLLKMTPTLMCFYSLVLWSLIFMVHILFCTVVKDTHIFIKPKNEYVDEKAKWLAFSRFLLNEQYVQKYLNVLKEDELWKDWLIYGIALGVHEKVVEYIRPMLKSCPELSANVYEVVAYLNQTKDF